MPFILRQTDSDINPTLPGGVYGKYITLGRPVYYTYDGTQTRFILFISDGGLYGLDRIEAFEYKSVAITEYVFHRGTLTKQVNPKAISGVDTGTDVITATAHGLVDTDPVRVRSTNGVLPVPLSKDAKYFVRDKTDDTFKLALTSGGAAIDITDAGSGSLIVWKADAGFDDPVQGLPTYVPEVNTTFSNIAYIEGKLPAIYGNAEPDWVDFRILGTGRRLMDYDNAGNELGVIDLDDDALQNVALQILDNLLINYKVDINRIDFPSWHDLKEASDVQILQRPLSVDTGLGQGKFTGRYYSDNDFSNLAATRLDTFVDFNFGVSAPIAGMPDSGWSIRWNGQVKPTFTEVYTFSLEHNESGKLWINGQLVISNVVADTNTVQMSLSAGQVYDIQVELLRGAGDGIARLKWQSASQALQNIPAISQDVVDTSIVNRYSNSAAFPNPVEASEVHERLMERVPGWDWTDDNGLIKFLAPDRSSTFHFRLDLIDDDSVANFVQKTFNKKRRRNGIRLNFQLFKYRNVQKFGYPTEYTQADRPEIRRFNNSEPSNEPAEDLGVSTRSLAERMAEMEMVKKADPKFSMNIDGLLPSSKIRKNDFIHATYIDYDNNQALTTTKLIVQLHSWGSKDGRNGFQTLPIPDVYYSDEELVVIPEEEPDNLNATFDTGSGNATLTWDNNGGLGNNLIERKKDAGGWAQVAVVAFNIDEWVDTTITLNGDYLYRVKNANVGAYSNEDGFTVSTESDPGDAPTDLTLSELDGVVTCDWVNNGGTGLNIIERKPLASGSWAQVGSVASGVDTFDDTTITVSDTYLYRVKNADEEGYTDEESIVVDIGGEIGSHPTDLYVEQNYYGVLIAYWNNHGGSGNNILEYESFGVYYQLAVVGFDESSVFFTLPGPGFYSLRISNESCSGYDYRSFYWNGGGGEF
jgi:hypothetical protein